MKTRHKPFRAGRQSAHAHNVGGGCEPYCPPSTAPNVPRSADGCPAGWLQCDQPLGVVEEDVGIGASATITVTPRRPYAVDTFLYLGGAGAFTIDSLEVDGTEFLGSSVPVSADTWAATVRNLTMRLKEIGPTTPLTMRVTNISGAAATFRGTFRGRAARAG
jgi:hypothetical protein